MKQGPILGRIQRTIARLVVVTATLGAHSSLASESQGWTIDPDGRVEISAISARSATRDEEFVVNGDALTFRGQAGIDIENEHTRFRLEADRIEVVRLGSDRSDSNRDRLTATFEQELSDDWEVQLRARYYDDLVTAESGDTDEIQGSVRVTFEPERAHRFRLRGTWREREYDNGAAPQTKGDGARFDAQYRHRFDRYHYLTFDLRTESINSDDLDRGYSRKSGKVSYTQPVTRDIRVRPAVEYLDTKFDGRFAPDGERRHDKLLVPELEVHWWSGNWRVEAEGKYIFSSSNQPSREREGHRLTLSVGYVF